MDIAGQLEQVTVAIDRDRLVSALKEVSVPIAPTRKEYSGRFNVRLDRRLHRALAIEAAKAGVSLNAIVSQKLAKTTEMPNGG